MKATKKQIKEMEKKMPPDDTIEWFDWIEKYVDARGIRYATLPGDDIMMAEMLIFLRKKVFPQVLAKQQKKAKL